MTDTRPVALKLSNDVHEQYSELYHPSEKAMAQILANWLDIREWSLREINQKFTGNELRFLLELLWLESAGRLDRLIDDTTVTTGGSQAFRDSYGRVYSAANYENRRSLCSSASRMECRI